MTPHDPLTHYIDLTAKDKAIVRAYVVEPVEAPRGAVVVLQQMDQRMPTWSGSRRNPPMVNARPGVGAHARQAAEQLATAGYLAVAPSTYSRGQSGVDYGYRFEQSRWDLRVQRPLQPLDSTAVMLDVEAAIEHARRLAPLSRVAVVGFCWGGLLAWRAACTMAHIDAAVCHYGGGMESDEEIWRQPHCPVLAHFPSDGKWMSRAGIRSFIETQSQPRDAAKVPAPQCHVYEAAYGFMQAGRSAYDEAAAASAHARTLAFLDRHLQHRAPA